MATHALTGTCMDIAQVSSSIASRLEYKESSINICTAALYACSDVASNNLSGVIDVTPRVDRPQFDL